MLKTQCFTPNSLSVEQPGYLCWASAPCQVGSSAPTPTASQGLMLCSLAVCLKAAPGGVLTKPLLQSRASGWGSGKHFACFYPVAFLPVEEEQGLAELVPDDFLVAVCCGLEKEDSLTTLLLLLPTRCNSGISEPCALVHTAGSPWGSVLRLTSSSPGLLSRN